jgi:hypothetical protein
MIKDVEGRGDVEAASLAQYVLEYGRARAVWAYDEDRLEVREIQLLQIRIFFAL